jgi:hypothetical protein
VRNGREGTARPGEGALAVRDREQTRAGEIAQSAFHRAGGTIVDVGIIDLP